MEATVLNLQNVLGERRRWCVPVYQRHYAWDTGEDIQLARLWEDIRGKAGIIDTIGTLTLLTSALNPALGLAMLACKIWPI